MTYARFGCEGSDVYLFDLAPGSAGRFECCGCQMVGSSWITKSAEAFLRHMHEHREAGHTVPDSAFDAFRDDLREIRASA
jgi:hypothetical protein